MERWGYPKIFICIMRGYKFFIMSSQFPFSIPVSPTLNKLESSPRMFLLIANALFTVNSFGLPHLQLLLFNYCQGQCQ